MMVHQELQSSGCGWSLTMVFLRNFLAAFESVIQEPKDFSLINGVLTLQALVEKKLQSKSLFSPRETKHAHATSKDI